LFSPYYPKRGIGNIRAIPQETDHLWDCPVSHAGNGWYCCPIYVTNLKNAACFVGQAASRMYHQYLIALYQYNIETIPSIIFLNVPK